MQTRNDVSHLRHILSLSHPRLVSITLSSYHPLPLRVRVYIFSLSLSLSISLSSYVDVVFVVSLPLHRFASLLRRLALASTRQQHGCSAVRW